MAESDPFSRTRVWERPTPPRLADIVTKGSPVSSITRPTPLVLAFLALALGVAAPTVCRAQSAVLTLSDGDSILVVDSLTREDGRLEVRCNSVGRARFVISATLTDDQAVSEARVRVWPEGRVTPQVDMAATLEDGVLRVGTTGEEGREEREVPANTLVYVPPSVSFLEQAARRARALRSTGDSAVALPLWSPYRGGRVIDAVARFPHPDTVTLSFDEATYTLAVDSAGHLLAGRLEPIGHTIRRE